MILVDADNTAIAKVPIDQRACRRVFREKDIGHAHQEGLVGCRSNRDPFIGKETRRVIVVRIDPDELGAGFFDLHVVVGGTARATVD